MANQFKTMMLLTLMTVLIMLAGRMLGGQQGMVAALVIAGAMNVVSYWFSDKMVLRMYNAEKVSPSQDPDLYGMIEELAGRAGLPMPRVYIIPQDAPNAFATGRNPENAVVAVTRGLLNLMNRDEIKGVLAHELGHIKNRDILIGTIAATMAGGVMMVANMVKWSAMFGGFRGSDDEGEGGFIGAIVMAIIAPIAALLIQMAISRSREYLADATAAQMTGNPEGLAAALEKLGIYSGRIPMAAEPSTAHMFIASPLSGRSFMGLFSTHPPIEDRVARLRNERSSSAPARGNRNPDPHQSGRDFWDSLRR